MIIEESMEAKVAAALNAAESGVQHKPSGGGGGAGSNGTTSLVNDQGENTKENCSC